MNPTRVTLVSHNDVAMCELKTLLEERMGYRIVVDMISYAPYFHIELLDVVASDGTCATGTGRPGSFLNPQEEARRTSTPFISFSLLFKAQAEAVLKWNLPFSEKVTRVLDKYKSWRLNRIAGRIEHAVVKFEKKHRKNPSLAMA